jgi:hypothetical protein
MEKKMFKKGFVVLFLMSVLVVFSGCAAHTALTKENKVSLKAVSIAQEVKKPDQIVVYGAGETFAAMGGFITLGVVGAVAAGEIPKKRGPLLKYVMEKEGIDPGQIMREQFVNKLKNSGLFAIADDGGDAEFKLIIIGIGFAKPAGFTGNLQPELRVEGTLAKPDGIILWKDTEVVTQGTSRTPRHKFKEYVNDPNLIREALDIAAGIVAEKLVKDLNK